MHEVHEVGVFTAETFIEVLLDKLLIGHVYIVDSLLICVVEQSEMVLEALVDQALVSLEEVPPLPGVLGRDRVEDRIVLGRR